MAMVKNVYICLLTLSYLDVGWYDSYLAPEYFAHGIVTEKTDVFAFGVFLLELITGRQPIDEHQHSLVMWVSILSEPRCKHFIDGRHQIKKWTIYPWHVWRHLWLFNFEQHIKLPLSYWEFPEYLIFQKSLEFSLIVQRPRRIPDNVLNTGFSG